MDEANGSADMPGLQQPAVSHLPFSTNSTWPFSEDAIALETNDSFSDIFPYSPLPGISSAASNLYYHYPPLDPFRSPRPLSPSTPLSLSYIAPLQEEDRNPSGYDHGHDLFDGALSHTPAYVHRSAVRSSEGRDVALPVTAFPGVGDDEGFEDPLRTPEFRLRCLIESNRRAHARISGTSNDATGSATGGSELETVEKNRSLVNFECSICLDLAKEPVVTSCGHLFCWPCLYRWLHTHSAHEECPVCKGEVDEASVTPIYGQGSSEDRVEERHDESRDTNLRIPPRPRGCWYGSRR